MKRLRDKMYHWETDPPAPVWDRVRAALDEGETSSHFPRRLYELETEPPADAWATLASSLDADTPAAPVVPLRSTRIRWIRYAAAIVLIAVAGFGIRFLMPGKQAELAVAPTAPVVKTPEPTIKPSNNLPALGEHATNDSLKNATATTSLPARRLSLPENELQFASDANQAYTDELNKHLYVYEEHQPRIAQNYVMLMMPDGSFIRISKKWSHLLCCVAGEETNTACDMQLKAWQDQMAESPVAPAPGNFIDLLELVNSVSEGTQL